MKKEKFEALTSKFPSIFFLKSRFFIEFLIECITHNLHTASCLLRYIHMHICIYTQTHTHAHTSVFFSFLYKSTQ